jgi:hypothetical protein
MAVVKCKVQSKIRSMPEEMYGLLDSKGSSEMTSAFSEITASQSTADSWALTNTSMVGEQDRQPFHSIID